MDVKIKNCMKRYNFIKSYIDLLILLPHMHFRSTEKQEHQMPNILYKGTQKNLIYTILICWLSLTVGDLHFLT